MQGNTKIKVSMLDKSLNVAVLHIADRLLPMGFDVSDHAPSTYEDLLDWYNKTRRISVWSGGSEKTIFGDREVNYAFRAWHDYHHIRLRAPFTAEGERAVLIAQQNDILTLYGYSDKTMHWLDILNAEIIGQREYEDINGVFPDDQMEFVKSYLKSRSFALSLEF